MSTTRYAVLEKLNNDAAVEETYPDKQQAMEAAKEFCVEVCVTHVSPDAHRENIEVYEKRVIVSEYGYEAAVVPVTAHTAGDNDD